MIVQLKIMSTTINGREARSGDDKGKVKWSVNFHAYSPEDRVPSTFVVYGLGSEAEASALASKFPFDTLVRLNYTPREAVYIDPGHITPVSASK